jgi:hypothetical protein
MQKDEYFAKVEKIWETYSKRIMRNDLEPKWVLNEYSIIQRFLKKEDLNPNELKTIKMMVESYDLPDGAEVSSFPQMPNSPKRIIHDGCKAGSFTWVFMGRSTENTFKHKDEWIISKREIPEEFYALLDQDLAPKILWIAYKLNEDQRIGPAVEYNQIVDYIGR